MQAAVRFTSFYMAGKKRKFSSPVQGALLSAFGRSGCSKHAQSSELGGSEVTRAGKGAGMGRSVSLPEFSWLLQLVCRAEKEASQYEDKLASF